MNTKHTLMVLFIFLAVGPVTGLAEEDILFFKNAEQYDTKEGIYGFFDFYSEYTNAEYQNEGVTNDRSKESIKEKKVRSFIYWNK